MQLLDSRRIAEQEREVAEQERASAEEARESEVQWRRDYFARESEWLKEAFAGLRADLKAEEKVAARSLLVAALPSGETDLDGFGDELASQIAEMDREDKVPCEVYSRIVGYLRPVQNWNKGKRQEFLERKTYRDCVDAAEVEGN